MNLLYRSESTPVLYLHGEGGGVSEAEPLTIAIPVWLACLVSPQCRQAGRPLGSTGKGRESQEQLPREALPLQQTTTVTTTTNHQGRRLSSTFTAFCPNQRAATLPPGRAQQGGDEAEGPEPRSHHGAGHPHAALLEVLAAVQLLHAVLLDLPHQCVERVLHALSCLCRRLHELDPVTPG